MRLRLHATVVTCLASLFLLLGGCEQPADTALAAPSSDSTTNISAAGSSFAAPMFNKWFELYATDHPDLKLGCDSVGSGEGIDRFLARTVDIGATDAPLRSDEAARVAGGHRQIPPGASYKDARAADMDPFSVDSTHWDHKVYYPGANEMPIRTTGERETGRLLGAQIVGYYGTRSPSALTSSPQPASQHDGGGSERSGSQLYATTQPSLGPGSDGGPSVGQRLALGRWWRMSAQSEVTAKPAAGAKLEVFEC